MSPRNYLGGLTFKTYFFGFAPYLFLPAAGMKLTSQLGKALRGGSKATDNSILQQLKTLRSDLKNTTSQAEKVKIEKPEIKEKKATLVFIDPQLDSRSGLFRVRFSFDNSELKIKPGVRVKVKLPGMEGRE